MKKIMIISTLISLLFGVTIGYIIGNYNSDSNQVNQYVCEVKTGPNKEISYTIWVDPEYNEFPEFYAAEKALERYDIKVIDYPVVDNDSNIKCWVYEKE